MEEAKVVDLLERMANGDETAFGELYNETRHDVFRMVVFLIPERHDAVEVANEVYVQIWKSFRSFDRSRSFRFWLHGIVVRQVNNHKRKVYKRFRLFEKQKQLCGPAAHTPDDPLLREEARDELLECVMKLSHKLRTLLVLRYYHDYSFEEIAALLDIPIGTVKSRHHAAMVKLRNAWIPNFNEKAGDSDDHRTTHTNLFATLRKND